MRPRTRRPDFANRREHERQTKSYVGQAVLVFEEFATLYDEKRAEMDRRGWKLLCFLIV
jgi:hypothetical protein